MRFSCSLPVDDIGDIGNGGGSSDNGFLSIAGISEMAVAIERAGLDATFVTDHPAPSRRWLDGGGHATLDPFVVLSVAAAATTRLRSPSYRAGIRLVSSGLSSTTPRLRIDFGK